MKIQVILDWINKNGYHCTFEGNPQIEITGKSSLAAYKEGSITWIKNQSGYDEVGRSVDITCAVVEKGVSVDCRNRIISDHSKELFFSILQYFWGREIKRGAVGLGTVISENAIIVPTVTIGCNCTIDGDIAIGANTIIENNVVIQGNVTIGENCIIHSGSVIGGDGYGYYFEDDGSIGKVEHFGGVKIDDQVEIGSNTCVDRGTIDDTVIGYNSKIDNLVHIAHNVRIGRNVCVVAGAAICGSVKLEEGSYVAPGAIVKNQLTIRKNGFVGLGAVVTKNVDEETVVMGVPAKAVRKIQVGDK